MDYYRAKPILKKAIQWNGFNISKIETIIGQYNVQGEFTPSCELLIKIGSGNFRMCLNDWLIIEDEHYYSISDKAFKASYIHESHN